MLKREWQIQFVEAVERAGIKPEDVVGTLKLHQSNTAGVQLVLVDWVIRKKTPV